MGEPSSITPEMVDQMIARRERSIDRTVRLLSPHLSDMAAASMRDALATVYHGGQVDIVARVDGREYRWEADWIKYLPQAIDQQIDRKE